MLSKQALAYAGMAVLSSGIALGQVTRRASTDSAGVQGNLASEYASISADRRWVVFRSSATNLVPGDTNATSDVFVHDRVNGTTECVSVDALGAPANDYSSLVVGSAAVSADGRFVIFTSIATNLVAGDVNGAADAFLRDRQAGTTELVSFGPAGNQGNALSSAYSISADGRYVAFLSGASNFGTGGGWPLLYLRDRQLGTTEVLSVDSGGAPGNSDCYDPILSPDGRFVVFTSLATNLVAGDTNGMEDIFLRDRQSSTTELVSLDSSGGQATDISFWPRVSADGRFVAFVSAATNLSGSEASPFFFDVFVRDRQTATTERISQNTGGTAANSHSNFASISDDGRYVAFVSSATDLIPSDLNGAADIFLRDRQAGTTQRVGVSSGGGAPNLGCQFPQISGDGVSIVFDAAATNLVPLDTNGQEDVFVRDWQGGDATTNFTSRCSPGAGGVIACPCSNPPSGPDRGCDNSAGTGGAALTASGNTELSADGLAFTITGEKPTALTILAQGSAFLSNGRVYGQGVRCPGGTIRRLFVDNAVLGTVTMPDLPEGGTPVSVRSAQKGDVIQPGQSRWYFAFYRDPSVLGGCPPASGFNASQTGEIAWSP